MTKIRTLFIFEILGKPADHIKDSLVKLIDGLKEQKGIEIVRRQVHEPKKAESKDKEGKVVVSDDLFSAFAEVEIETEDINLILAIVLNMLPSHVEIIEPSEYKFKNFELSSLLSELTVKIHRYDEMAKMMLFERDSLLKKLQFVEQKLKEKGVEIDWEGGEKKKEEINEKMENNIIISNPEDFDKKKNIFKGEGSEKVHVITDFDRTLTKAFVNGKKVTAIIMQLYDGNFLTKDYREKAQALHDKYRAIEIDQNVPIEEKKKAMDEWWRTHKHLLIDSGLSFNDIRKVVDEGYLEFRGNIGEFLDTLKDKDIPLVVFSSSGLGEAIPLYFEKINKMYDNIHIITNSMKYDEDGNAIDIIEPIIHSLNKGEIALKGLPIRKELEDRKNVILLGDSLGDLGMIEGFDYDNLIKIGFLNYKDEENLEDYKKAYDVVIMGDGDFSFINELMRELN